ncbi:YtxH domain-containing protein [Acidobacteria bacterium AH-259-D05]|nr:YtxH domain-containing protein [Acidobacteria bacterium AH-259-D05]
MASGGDKFIYFLVGGFVGASVALLFAPKTGNETREFLENKYKEGTARLGSKAQEGKERISEKSLEVAGRVSESINKGKEILNQQKEQVAAAIDAGKEAYEQERSKLQGVSGGKKKRKKSVS